ncbi:MAG: hypothetical protein Q9169_006330 [Polycauliona sp. 2 TL-2023]
MDILASNRFIPDYRYATSLQFPNLFFTPDETRSERISSIIKSPSIAHAAGDRVDGPSPVAEYTSPADEMAEWLPLVARLLKEKPSSNKSARARSLQKSLHKALPPKKPLPGRLKNSYIPNSSSRVGPVNHTESNIRVSIATSNGAEYMITIDSDATVAHFIRTAEKIVNGLEQMKLVHIGQVLRCWNEGEEMILSDYDICGTSTVYAVLLENVAKTGIEEAEGRHPSMFPSPVDDYDEDPHIVDPKRHYEMLENLEYRTFERSAYCEAKRDFGLSSALWQVPVDCEPVRFGSLPKYFANICREHMEDLPEPLRDRILHNSIMTKLQSFSRKFWLLYKSYSIIMNASQELGFMERMGFCTHTFNVIVAHEDVDVIEIRRIVLEEIKTTVRCLESIVHQIVHTQLEECYVETAVIHLAMEPCRRIFEQFGIEFPETERTYVDYYFQILRKVAVIIDMAVVSYVRSHGSGFDKKYFHEDIVQLEFIAGAGGRDDLSFRCYWAELTCLDSFLDRKQVWVFDFNHKNFKPPRERWLAQEDGPKSLLARIEDLADIWGPIYTVPSSTGLVKYYAVSKGVICKVPSIGPNGIPGAVDCHYFPQESFYEWKASRLLFGDKDLLLSQSDLLLIGAGQRINESCQYTMSSFVKDYRSEMTMLGPKKSAWITDSRSLTIGISKYLGVTVAGTQKLIPQTTLKQHILNKWRNMPSRSNPTILNQFLAVEVSHCTGNARRISLKQLMTSKSMWSILDRQTPNWHQTVWGGALNRALHSIDAGHIVNVWKEFATNRIDIAELVCCTLELLDATGWNDQGDFNSAVLVTNEEWAVSIPKKLNNWVFALRETHLTGAYVMTNELCIEFELPDQTGSTCGKPGTLTTLQTQITTAKSLEDMKPVQVLLKPSDKRFQRTFCGYHPIVHLTPLSPYFSRLSIKTELTVLYELLNRGSVSDDSTTAYLIASRTSHGGMPTRPKVIRLEVTRLEDTRAGVIRSEVTRPEGQSSVANTRLGRKAASRSFDRGLGAGKTPSGNKRRVQPDLSKDTHSEIQRSHRRKVHIPFDTARLLEAQHDASEIPSFVRGTGPASVHAGEGSMQNDDYDGASLERRQPSSSGVKTLWPINSHGSQGIQGLIQSDIQGQDSFCFSPNQIRPLATRTPIKRQDSLCSSQIESEAPGRTLDGELKDLTVPKSDTAYSESESTPLTGRDKPEGLGGVTKQRESSRSYEVDDG